MNAARTNGDPPNTARRAIAPHLLFTAVDPHANGVPKKVHAASMSAGIARRAISPA
jgi:hypothetical protein